MTEETIRCYDDRIKERERVGVTGNVKKKRIKQSNYFFLLFSVHLFCEDTTPHTQAQICQTFAHDAK